MYKKEHRYRYSPSCHMKKIEMSVTQKRIAAVNLKPGN
ncbi:hypothetical protein CFter6_2931 [Collimonas fungivorans]|uniref:Uncharacterized protein n=1 Tax=Collimonas fungivorans TaxID=158899 RepID=A0A127PCY2_9BURK|nr:hypothetical protein CFter6_2931 [Collimonas fungivorans]